MKRTATIFAATVALLMTATGAVAQIAQPNPPVPPPASVPNTRPPNAPPLPYRFAPGPQGPNGAKFGAVSAVALTPAGHLLVLNRNPAIMVVEYDQSGKFVRAILPNIAANAHGMRVDRHGNIWVVDSFLNVIWKLNPQGEPLMLLGTRGEVGTWDDEKWNKMFNQPVDIAFDNDDNIYVAQGHGGSSAPASCTFCATYQNSKPAVAPGSDPRIIKLDKSGNFISSRAFSHADGSVPIIHTAILSPAGEIWVSDRQLNKIIVLDRDLKMLRDVIQPNLVSGLYVDAKNQMWMSAGVDGFIMKLDSDGKVQAWIGKAGRTSDTSEPNVIGEAHYLVVTPDQSTIYLADSANAKVHKLVRE